MSNTAKKITAVLAVLAALGGGWLGDIAWKSQQFEHLHHVVNEAIQDRVVTDDEFGKIRDAWDALIGGWPATPTATPIASEVGVNELLSRVPPEKLCAAFRMASKDLETIRSALQELGVATDAALIESPEAGR
jgi:hypothetical protein